MRARNAARSTSAPLTYIFAIRRVLRISSSGLASSTRKSACLPGASVPVFLELEILGRPAGRRDDHLHRRHSGRRHELELALLGVAEQVILQAGVAAQGDPGARGVELRSGCAGDAVGPARGRDDGRVARREQGPHALRCFRRRGVLQQARAGTARPSRRESSYGCCARRRHVGHDVDVALHDRTRSARRPSPCRARGARSCRCRPRPGRRRRGDRRRAR